MAKLQQFKGFASVRSDYYHDTPNLRIDINRDRAATYGVSTSAIQNLLRSAYSQNYVYLIKEPDDQYQVILEAQDNARTSPQDFRQIYVKPDSGNTMIPIRAVTKAEETLGLESVNHLNQFTAVTFGFDIKPDVALGDAVNYIE